jgi:exopolysaccharide biosynthesis WecB/TagA/CpsF family protein
MRTDAQSSGDSVGCKIDDYDLDTFSRVLASFGSDRYGYVVTPNVDHLIRYREDPSFREFYRSADYTALDSRVVAGAVRLTKGVRLAVCTGSDLTAALLSEAISPDDRILVVGGSRTQAEALAAKFALRNVRHHNPPLGFVADPRAVEKCLQFIENQSPFRFCFLALGSPQQEMIAYRLRGRGRARGLVLCVGAALNFISGAEKRAPRWVQRLALEWLYRLCHDPRRLAGRYLVRGPRIFGYLLRDRVVLLKREDATST